MIQNQSIVCVSYTTWAGDFVKSTVQLMSYLALNNQVLFCEYPFTIKDVFSGMMGNRVIPVRKILGLQARISYSESITGAKVWLFNPPPVLPFSFLTGDRRFYQALKFNSSIISRSLHKSIQSARLTNPVVVNAFNPFAGLNMIGKLGESAHIYYCYDAINDSRNKGRGLEVENKFCSLVDGVITTSDELFLSKSKINSNTYLVKNGVEFELFNKIVDLQKPILNKRKKIGFIGSIDFRFDIDLFSWLAEQLPGYDFLVVGRNANEDAYQKLAKMKNVTLQKPVKPEEVPQIMYSCDAGLIPLTQIPINRNVYPMKINEYLSVGLPVVRTNFADLPEFDHVVSTAGTKEEFLTKLVYEVENDSITKKQHRIDVARNNSWASRAEEFSNAIVKILDSKSKKSSKK